jgi:sugar/nucleoside kinase (ribokinase family)
MEKRELKYNLQELRFSGIVGTGGIGSGKFFKLNGDHTLGREESRSGHFLDINDYCKQHIILHYISVLLGTPFMVIPIGKIGDDDIGKSLYNEMVDAGFIMDHVAMVPNVSTLFSFCFYYPDGTGGNLTTDNSASAMVDAGFIGMAGDKISDLGSRGIILAVPEVPLYGRQELLKIGKKNKLFCAASFTTEEIPTVLKERMLSDVDLIAINIDEASAISGNHVEKADLISVVNSAIKKLQLFNKNIMVSITAGKDGSWSWDGNQMNFSPAIISKTVSTAGAGDAFFSGLLCGLVLGLHMKDSQQLASLIAGLSVTSPHTINKGVTRSTINEFMITSGFAFSEETKKLLED